MLPCMSGAQVLKQRARLSAGKPIPQAPVDSLCAEGPRFHSIALPTQDAHRNSCTAYDPWCDRSFAAQNAPEKNSRNLTKLPNQSIVMTRIRDRRRGFLPRGRRMNIPQIHRVGLSHLRISHGFTGCVGSLVSIRTKYCLCLSMARLQPVSPTYTRASCLFYGATIHPVSSDWRRPSFTVLAPPPSQSVLAPSLNFLHLE